MRTTSTTTARSSDDQSREKNNQDDDEDSRFIKSYRLQGVGRQSRVDVRMPDTEHSIQTDLPTHMGGTNVAPQPVETMLAALVGCTQATAVFVGRHMEPRINIDRLEFQDIHATRDERGPLKLPITQDPVHPARLQCITGTIRVYTNERRRTTRQNKKQPDVVATPAQPPLSTQQLQELSRQTELRCPVANMMIASGCRMNVQWIDGNNNEIASNTAAASTDNVIDDNQKDGDGGASTGM